MNLTKELVYVFLTVLFIFTSIFLFSHIVEIDKNEETKQAKSHEQITRGELIENGRQAIKRSHEEQRTKSRESQEVTQTSEEKRTSESESKSSGGNNGLTTNERELLTKLVRAETRGESYEGKVAVARVILNRVDSGEFPNSITSVIQQSGQFQPVSNGSIWNMRITDVDTKAVNAALRGEGGIGDALFFMNPDIAATNWIAESRERVKRIDNHVFYR